MQKLLLLLIAMLFTCGIANAQERVVSGSVTDTNGAPLPGVFVLVKEFSAGTTTDFNGNFKLSLDKDAKLLTFRSVGYMEQTVEIGNQTSFSIKLVEDVQQLGEVVVTALGVTREERSIGYAVQQVDSKDLATKDPTSVINSLQGKVAGVQIKSASGAVGGSSSMVIRGYSSLSGSNQPLFIVDGTPINNYNLGAPTSGYDLGNGAQDINPEDVASVSVLKGAAATALYGSRAANGVVIITTKSGKSRKGLGIEINTGITFDNIYITPNLQNEYAGGRSMDTFEYNPSVHGPEWEKFDGAPAIETGRDESWGPKMDGTPVLMWHSFVPESETYNQLVPLNPQSDNYKKMFDTGITTTNSIAFTGGNETSQFRMGITNINQKGIVPFTKLDKTTLSLKASSDVNRFINAFAAVNYVNQKTRRPLTGYTESGSNTSSLRTWSQRQLDPDMLRKYTYSPSLVQEVGWNMRDIGDGRLYTRWSNNPFWSMENIFAKDKKNRIYGNAGLKFKLNDALSITTTARTDHYSMEVNEQVGVGGVLGTEDAYYSEYIRTSTENNYEAIVNYNKRFNDNISVNAILGGNIRQVNARITGVNTGSDGIILDNFFNVRNAANKELGFASSIYESQINSIFASGSVGYKDMLFLDASHRIDWSSTLPVENNRYGYSAVSGSFVFSELLSNQDILSFGKLRAGYGQAGKDTDAYQLYKTYTTGNYGDYYTFNLPNQLPNSDLVNELSSEIEFGLETQFFNGRVGLSATYFDKRSKNQILDVNIPAVSGFTSTIVNAGEIQNSGVELLFNVKPIETKDFDWNLSFNIAKYNSKIIELFEGMDEYTISQGASRAWVKAEVGSSWGDLYVRNGYKYDDNGNRIVQSNGLYAKSDEPVNVGSVLPDFNGGVLTSFRYKSVSLSAQLDFVRGGMIYSNINLWGARAGTSAMTVGTNDNGMNYRDPIEEGGGYKAAGVVINETTGQYETNETYASAFTFFRDLTELPEAFVYDASYVKFRELSISYILPKKWTSQIGIPTASISLTGRNLALLHSNTDGFDPEINTTTSNAIGYESGQFPSTRSIGFKLNIKL
ncbi:SusC/RagA family TonB-linked outer membrane protein [Limibacter armeniacum]|uniref:SusC/RagA family TonB-linked outer membrane protein n=1 Tax=Limibacter armeniacum TaxID=466084 RepID=UPI002FE67F05